MGAKGIKIAKGNGEEGRTHAPSVNYIYARGRAVSWVS